MLRSSLRGLFFGAVWLTLAGPEDPSSWIIGIPTVFAAAWCYDRLSPGERLRLSLLAVVRFVPVFLWESFKSGIDVARRVIGPRLDVDPGLRDYKLRLTLPAARVFFVDLVCLLPGTLSADLQGDTLRIHALDRNVDLTAELLRLEKRVAAIFRDETSVLGP